MSRLERIEKLGKIYDSASRDRRRRKNRLAAKVTGIPALEEELLDEESKKQEAEVQNLDHLEDLAKTGRLMKLIWVLVLAGCLAAWLIWFLVCLYTPVLDKRYPLLQKAREDYVEGYSLNMNMRKPCK